MEVDDPQSLVERIDTALSLAEQVLTGFGAETIAEMTKMGGDPVTAADIEIDRLLREALIAGREGWLSEETVDDQSRLGSECVWIVDPLDGTREFIDGIPEFCTSVAAVRNGRPIAGGIVNPAAGLRIIGAVGLGVTVNRVESAIQPTSSFESLTVLASRSEVRRGQWGVVENSGIIVVPMGSVAYKLARVAAGIDQATWTPVPKHEWDVAGGAALLRAANGTVLSLDGKEIEFNQPRPWMSGAIAMPPGFEKHLPTVQRLVEKQVAKSE